MPIEKFRSVEDSGRRTRLEPGTPEHVRAVRSVFWIAAKLAPSRPFPPGVYKYRSIEEAQAQRKSWARRPA